MLACPGGPGTELGLDVRRHGERHRVHVAQELGEVRVRVDAELLAESRRLVGVASPDSCKVNPGLTRQHGAVRHPGPISRTYKPEPQALLLVSSRAVPSRTARRSLGRCQPCSYLTCQTADRAAVQIPGSQFRCQQYGADNSGGVPEPGRDHKLLHSTCLREVPLVEQFACPLPDAGQETDLTHYASTQDDALGTIRGDEVHEAKGDVLALQHMRVGRLQIGSSPERCPPCSCGAGCQAFPDNCRGRCSSRPTAVREHPAGDQLNAGEAACAPSRDANVREPLPRLLSPPRRSPCRL